MTYTNSCIYRVVPPDDEQEACSKHVEVNYWNKLKVDSASCWFLLYGYIMIHGQQNIKFATIKFKLWLQVYHQPCSCTMWSMWPQSSLTHFFILTVTNTDITFYIFFRMAFLTMSHTFARFCVFPFIFYLCLFPLGVKWTP